MFQTDFAPSAVSFHRLEDFTSYTSCIKCFGRAIIPPLLTSRQKEEIDGFRATAARKEADILRRRAEKSPNIHNAVGAFTPIKEECFILCQKSNDASNFFPTRNNEFSALCSSNVIGFQPSLSTGTSFPVKQMHMSMSKIPSNGICSTVHNGVIVSTNIYNDNKSYSNAFCGNAEEASNSHAIKEFCPHLANPVCHLCQVDCHPYSFTDTGVPYESLYNEQMTSVSEAEVGSGTEEIEFESLPTVICARKSISHDTDNESSTTCLTQSTDLEKYMDCSIEFSSPDDQSHVAKLQTSSQLTISSRSDDASSETLVNTESELTPCASAMDELTNYDDDACLEDAGAKSNIPPSVNSSDVHQRALSVDSYMKILKTCARNLFIKKSQSAPSRSEGSSLGGRNELDSVNAVSNCDRDGNLKEGFEVSDFQPIEDLSPMKPDSKDNHNADLNPDNIKTSRKRRIRKNSYTLDQPSSALIEAHADCNCWYDSSNASPHSCSLGTKSETPNPAFKKEKINRAFSLTPDQYKYLPVLSSSSCPVRNGDPGFEKSIPSSKSGLEPDAGCSGSTMVTQDDSEVNSEPDESRNPNKLGNSPLHCEIEMQQNEQSSVQSIPVDSTKDESETPLIHSEVSAHQNEQMSVISPVDLPDVKSDDIKKLIVNNLCEARERHRIRVKQLFEQQDQQWLKLQQEFQEEERLLSEKFHLIEMPSLSDNVPILSSNVPLSRCDVEDNVSSNVNMEPISNAVSSIAEEKNCIVNKIELLNETSKNETVKISPVEPSTVRVIPEPHASVRDDSKSDRLSNLTSLGSLSSVNSTAPPSISVSRLKDFSRKNDVNNLEQATVIADNILKHSTIGNSPNRPNSVQSSIPLFPVSDASDQMKVHSVSAPSTRSNSRQCFTSVNSEMSSAASCKVDTFRNPNNGYRPVHICNSSKAENARRKSAFKNYPSIDLHNMANILSSDIVLESPPNRGNDYNNVYNLLDDVHSSRASTLGSSSRFICNPEEKFPNPDTVHENVFLCQANTYQGEITKEHKTDGNFIDECHIQNYVDHNQKNFQQNVPTYLIGLKSLISNSVPMQNPYCENNITSMCDSALLLPGCGSEADSSKTAAYHSSDVDKASVNSANPLTYPPQNEIPEYVGDFKANRSSTNNSSNNSMMQECSDFTRSTSNFDSQAGQSNEQSKSSSVNSNTQTSRANSSNSQRTDHVLSSSPVRALKQATSASMTNLRRKHIRSFIKDHTALNNKTCTFEKLPAFVKGYLTRRLFKTERVEGLIKTLQDTVIVTIRVSEELTLKGDSVSETDVHFYQQLMVQLMGTYRCVYDIFSTISTKERMQIIAESRNLRLKKREVGEAEHSPVVVDKSADSMSTQKPKLSAATIKTLERKRRPNIENRTYSLKDLRTSSPRKQSSTSLKSHPTSPSCIYKSAGLSMKRKSTSVCKARPWK